jgi:hypothetical protein
MMSSQHMRSEAQDVPHHRNLNAGHVLRITFPSFGHLEAK